MSCESIGKHSRSLHWFKCPTDVRQFEGTPYPVNVETSTKSFLLASARGSVVSASAKGIVGVPVVQASTACVLVLVRSLHA